MVDTRSVNTPIRPIAAPMAAPPDESSMLRSAFSNALASSSPVGSGVGRRHRLSSFVAATNLKKSPSPLESVSGSELQNEVEHA